VREATCASGSALAARGTNKSTILLMRKNFPPLTIGESIPARHGREVFWLTEGQSQSKDLFSTE